MKTGSNNTKQIIIIVGIVAVVIFLVWMIPNTVLSLDGMLAKGEMYQKTGRTALALKIYERATEMYPSSYEAHLHLGNALLEVDEPELAKHQFDKAVELSGSTKTKSDAQIAMASMLMAENKYDKAEKLLLSVEDPKPDKVKAKLGEMYVAWGEAKYTDTTRLDSIEKYKQAFKYYDAVDVEAQQKVEDKIIKTYNDMANEYLSQKKIDQAIGVLKNSIDFIDNSSAHIKLAEVYKKQNKRDESIAEYEKAYDLDTTGTAALYLGELLVEKGVDLARKNEMDKAKECFEKAQEANPSIIIPAEILYSLSIENIKTSLTPNTVTDEIFPKVSFVVVNKGKENVDFMKVQAVFIDSGKIINRTEVTVANKSKPLLPNKPSPTITLASSDGVKGIKSARVIQAKLYLVYSDHPDWKFARTLTLSKKKEVVTANKPSSSSSGSSSSSSKPSASSGTRIDTTAILPKEQQRVIHDNQTSVPSASTGVGSPSVPQPIPLPVQVQPGSSDVELPPINKDFKIE